MTLSDNRQHSLILQRRCFFSHLGVSSIFDNRMTFRAEPVSIEKVVEKQRTPFKLSDAQQEKQIRGFMTQFQPSGETILKFADVFTEQMEKGLQYDGSSPFTMQSTFVHSLLDGREKGRFLGLDLGGTNFRIVLVEVSEGKIIKEEVGHYDVSEEIRMGSGVELFDYLASSLEDFTIKHGLIKDNLPLGFTFSFPMEQPSLDSGILTTWIGQYNVSGVVGQNVVNMFREAIARRGTLNVEVSAILNDTTGTLIRGSLLDKNAAIALILGTGSNACYIEKTSRMAGWTGKEEEVVLNIEWGPLPDKGLVDFIKTELDKEIDKHSLHPGLFVLEKFVGGKFLGELVRLIMIDLTKKGLLFDGRVSDLLNQHEAFQTPFISKIEQDNLEKVSTRTKSVLNDLGINWHSEDDVKIMKFICEEISIRMALLAAACIGEIVKRIDRPDITVAVDGSVYKFHPRLHHYLTEFTTTLVGNQKHVKYILAEDGGGIGAALLAALVSKEKQI